MSVNSVFADNQNCLCVTYVLSNESIVSEMKCVHGGMSLSGEEHGERKQTLALTGTLSQARRFTQAV